MSKSLKLEDVTIIQENNKRIRRFVFNDDKVVRVDDKTGKAITSNVPSKYKAIINAYLLGQSQT